MLIYCYVLDYFCVKMGFECDFRRLTLLLIMYDDNLFTLLFIIITGVIQMMLPVL